MKPQTTYIYSLSDPITGMIRYVGKSNQPKKRLRSHIEDRFNKRSHKRSWITSLKSQKSLPTMSIIDEVPIEEWRFWEKFYVALFRTWGFNLVNHTCGGDGCTFGNSTSFKKGQVPKNKGKKLSEYTKEKIRVARSKQVMTELHKKAISKSKKGKLPPYMRQNGINEDQLRRMSATHFKKGQIAWNKGLHIALKKPRIVVEFDLNMNFIREWESTKIVAKHYEYSEETIASCCRGNIKQVGKKYIFRYKDNDND